MTAISQTTTQSQIDTAGMLLITTAKAMGIRAEEVEPQLFWLHRADGTHFYTIRIVLRGRNGIHRTLYDIGDLRIRSIETMFHHIWRRVPR